MVDFAQFLSDNNIPHWTSGKNVAPGWVNIQCPFCDDHSNHGGFNPKKEYYSCWKCGWQPLDRVIKSIIGSDISALNDYKQYTKRKKKKVITKKKRGTKLKVPYGLSPLNTKSRMYLKSRGFDPTKLETKYGIQSTSFVGDYKFRIYVPIYFKGQLISFHTRDYTNKQNLAWMSCDKENEIIHYKNIVYNYDNIINRTAIIVEGIADVWKLGYGAVCTFGTGYTKEQVTLLAKSLDTVYILFDNEVIAQKKATKLGNELAGLGVDVEIVQLIGYNDPGEMPIKKAQKLKKSLIYT